jgi:hypothetical protein
MKSHSQRVKRKRNWWNSFRQEMKLSGSDYTMSPRMFIFLIEDMLLWGTLSVQSVTEISARASALLQKYEICRWRNVWNATRTSKWTMIVSPAIVKNEILIKGMDYGNKTKRFS